MTSATITDQLARVYREARVLVLGDRSPKIDRAFALYREFGAVRASFMQQPEDDRSEWEAMFLEKTRRATIVALRHQALAIKDRWVEGTASIGSDQSSPHVNPEHALQLAAAAIELHVEDDPDLSRTTQAVERIRQSLAGANASFSSSAGSQGAGIPARSIVTDASPSPAASVPPSPSQVVLASHHDLVPASLAGTHQDDTIGPQALSETRQRGGVNSKIDHGRPRAAVSWTPTPWSVVLLIAAGFAFFAIDIGKSRPTIETGGRLGGVGTQVRPLSTPRGTVVTEVPRSLATPSAVRNTTVLLMSQPEAARVTVEGVARGTTPLTLEGKPGEQWRVVMQKGDWIWRGTLTLDTTGKQVVTIRLAPGKTAQTLRHQSTPALPSERARLAATLRGGIELYRRGWFGPAVARFKAAVALDPRSAEAHLWLGRTLLRVGRHAEARRALEKVVALGQSGPLTEEATALLGKLRPSSPNR